MEHLNQCVKNVALAKELLKSYCNYLEELQNDTEIKIIYEVIALLEVSLQTLTSST